MPKNRATMQHTKPAIPLLLELLPAVAQRDAADDDADACKRYIEPV